jgi:hypothetical protein
VRRPGVARKPAISAALFKVGQSSQASEPVGFSARKLDCEHASSKHIL